MASQQERLFRFWIWTWCDTLLHVDYDAGQETAKNGVNLK